MKAVISADLINSTEYPEQLLNAVLDGLKAEFQLITESKEAQFSLFRGDSFQGVVENPSEALKIVLLLKSAINRIHLQDTRKRKAFPVQADIRTAIGIGSVDFQRETISESNGQAFQFSGRTLDDMKNGPHKLLLACPDDEVNGEFQASFLLFDQLADRWSTASAEVVYFSLKGLKEKEIAEKLGISQSAVNQRKKASGWEAIEVLLNRFESVISEKFSDGK
ncbi:helix-turn-helix domain-containing protein [Christiangramia flava]|uniref:Uncharacterized protein n=1 Tax=Christiangramia flava JLT2011 TaxID=1229726 RepID=A0A1L7I9P6_9FLAO|nr:helix-turn-helix domain-containing protein [Christiangramia flava]APU69923.1 hypothetical protein GRFL_3199 [Christiangramia flava JLT2011]OSS39408.1 hypothetical protein C723_1310 [Christiangramia flava JLT2011]